MPIIGDRPRPNLIANFEATLLMQLRFPLPEGYFAKFELLPAEAQSYRSLATDIVRDEPGLRPLRQGRTQPHRRSHVEARQVQGPTAVLPTKQHSRLRASTRSV